MFFDKRASTYALYTACQPNLDYNASHSFDTKWMKLSTFEDQNFSHGQSKFRAVC
jgi:hypothetical protein